MSDRKADSHGRVKPGRFLTNAQFAWFNFARELNYYDLADSLHMMCPPREWNGYPDMGGFTLNITPGDPFPPLTTETLKTAWHRQIEEIRRHGRLFDFWGIYDCVKLPEGPGYKAMMCAMPRDAYDHMIGRVGDLFIGWDMGEWDGLYGRDVVFYWKPEEYPKTRREAYDRFMAYLRRLHGYAYHNACTIVGCTFPHYFHELPIRMLGAEIGQGLLNVQVYNSFLRGAGRQYSLEFKVITSVFDRWGYKCYASAPPLTMPDEHGGKIVFGNRPYDGHSIGLLHAMWITGYFAGAAIMGLDGGYFSDVLDERGVRKLSPLGKTWMEFREWSRTPTPRGRQVRPLALLLDYHSGWTPPRHLYSMRPHTVWHSLPYGPSDYGMDRAYDLFYPGYTDSGFFRDERGFLTPTPIGDGVDVLLSDAGADALNAYPVIWHLSDETPEPALLDRLRAYVAGGGHLIISGAPMVALAQVWFGLTIGAETRRAIAAVFGPDEENMREAHYAVRTLPLDSSWTRVAATEAGDPLIAFKVLDRGRVTFFAADHGLTGKLTAPGLDQNPRWDYTPEAPYELLHSVQRYVKSVVRNHMPVTIDVPGVYYGVNELAADRYAVCLYNPGHEPWTGALHTALPDQSVRPLAGCWAAPVLDGAILTLPANQTTVVEIAGKP